MWGREREGGGEYWPQWEANYGPQHGHHRPRLHNTALTAPAPYAGGLRREGGPMTEMGARNWTGPGAPLYQDFNAPPKPHPLVVHFKAKSTEAEVKWEHPPVTRSTPYKYQVTVEGGANNQVLEFPQWRGAMRLRVTAGTWYKVHIKALSSEKSRVLAEGLVEFKSVFDRDELALLYDKAVDYSGDRLEPFEVFYRNKPKAYWDNIRQNRNGVMEVYIKDKNGQAATPINDVIYGLFLSANMVNGRIPPTSPFGDVRLIIPAPKLYTPSHHVYFADFYCNYSIHYVTIVVCLPGSVTDRYCAKALLPLDPATNSFLRVAERGGWLEYSVNPNLWVETYYTENIEIDIGMFDQVRATGRSTPGGLPNNKHCVVCNLYPVAIDPSQAMTERRRAAYGRYGDPTDRRRRELEEEESADFNSTFHLCMAIEREKLGDSDSTDLGDFDVVETICALVDSTIVEVGDTLMVPSHGYVGFQYQAKKKKEEEPVKETPKELPQPGNDGVEDPLTVLESEKKIKSDLGKKALDTLLTRKKEMDKRMEEIQKMLTTVENSFNALEAKLKVIK